jgi:hypothetical protein
VRRDVVRGAHHRRLRQVEPQQEQVGEQHLDEPADRCPLSHEELRPVHVQHVVRAEDRAQPREREDLDLG